MFHRTLGFSVVASLFLVLLAPAADAAGRRVAPRVPMKSYFLAFTRRYVEVPKEWQVDNGKQSATFRVVDANGVVQQSFTVSSIDIRECDIRGIQKRLARAQSLTEEEMQNIKVDYIRIPGTLGAGYRWEDGDETRYCLVPNGRTYLSEVVMKTSDAKTLDFVWKNVLAQLMKDLKRPRSN